MNLFHAILEHLNEFPIGNVNDIIMSFEMTERRLYVRVCAKTFNFSVIGLHWGCYDYCRKSIELLVYLPFSVHHNGHILRVVIVSVE